MQGDREPRCFELRVPLNGRKILSPVSSSLDQRTWQYALTQHRASPPESASPEQPTMERDEAASLPQLCSSSSPVLASTAADCRHDMSPHPCAVTASGRRQKKLKTVQVTTPIAATRLDRLPCRRQSLPLCVKRKSDSQSAASAARRSTRQRIDSKVFDPSDPTAIAGYVQARGTSPDTQSGLPFDTG